MKKLLLFFLLLPSYVFACDCNRPSVALEFVSSKYVFWGTVVEKVYAKDSLTYTVTFKIDRHFKKPGKTPKTLTFTKEAKDYLTSCGYSVNKGEKWIVYAYEHEGAIVFSSPCSNSNRYRQLSDVRKAELDLLAKGPDIDLQKIKFDHTTAGSLYNNYKGAEPGLNLDSLLAHLNPAYFSSENNPDFESVVLHIDSKGDLTDIKISNRKLVDVKQVYDIRLYEYGIQPEPLTALQKDILSILKNARKWKPASFAGVNVNSQINLLIRFEKGKKPYIANL